MDKSSKGSDERELQELLKRKDIANIYFNEFAVGVSENDIFIVLSRNGNTDCILNLSHITAQKLGTFLQEVTKDINEKEDE